jgi:hypothetical protein
MRSLDSLRSPVKKRIALAALLLGLAALPGAARAGGPLMVSPESGNPVAFSPPKAVTGVPEPGDPFARAMSRGDRMNKENSAAAAAERSKTVREAVAAHAKMLEELEAKSKAEEEARNKPKPPEPPTAHLPAPPSPPAAP